MLKESPKFEHTLYEKSLLTMLLVLCVAVVCQGGTYS